MSNSTPRITDLRAILPSTLGKIELEYTGDDPNEAEVVEKILQKAVHAVFAERFNLEELSGVVAAFHEGWGVEVSDEMPSAGYLQGMDDIKGLRPAVAKLVPEGTPGQIASAIEFILEGLHLNNKLNKEVKDGSVVYR